ncbi:MAG: hypothetical protein N0E58_17550 [Candidatus Thiodiazotropha endolucinida]|uniref:Uncharacterized protein n=1 Tax=Candidatus Thiodiazotropha taylori TaxID=2792791 RepID=A0A9E4NN66_9GAMM|nr:hypothetical protein [Candidatus Thiodiazotropha taylori]MCW4238054.1 hypothetical protein [Candidatus Thiodiazotropha endolucinida]
MAELFFPWVLLIMLVILSGGALLVSAEDRASLKRARREIARLQSEIARLESEIARLKDEYNFTLLRVNEKHEAELRRFLSGSGLLRAGQFSDDKGDCHDQ